MRSQLNLSLSLSFYLRWTWRWAQWIGCRRTWWSLLWYDVSQDTMQGTWKSKMHTVTSSATFVERREADRERDDAACAVLSWTCPLSGEYYVTLSCGCRGCSIRIMSPGVLSRANFGFGRRILHIDKSSWWR